MSPPLWTSEALAAAVSGTASASFSVEGVSIDTRSIEPGDLFVALAGARDGHDFIAQARARGASASLVSRPVEGHYVQVADVFAALEDLGRAARARVSSDFRCAAVTGSVGKTSVTQAIGAALRLAGDAHASVKSYNNHIGVPLTLARMPATTRRAVFEIGMNHAHEITPLAKMVRPDVAVVTTVGAVHVENFPDGEIGVARAKAEIFEGMAPGGTAVLNADDGWFELLSDAARAAGAEILSFGRAPKATARLISLTPEGEGQLVEGEVFGKPTRFYLAQKGDHWGLNALTVLLATERLGLDQALALEALGQFGPLAGRGAERSLALAGGGEALLIDESYNANPLSMGAVIKALGERRVAGRRILALTDMLELGEQELAMHAGLLQPILQAGVDKVYLTGSRMAALWHVLPKPVRGGFAEEAGALAPLVRAALEPGDVVLVKGSNGSRASVIVDALSREEGR